VLELVLRLLGLFGSHLLLEGIVLVFGLLRRVLALALGSLARLGLRMHRVLGVDLHALVLLEGLRVVGVCVHCMDSALHALVLKGLLT